MIDSNTRLTKAMIDAMTLAEFEELSPDEKVLVDIAQYAETKEYSKLWTAHNDGKREAKTETARNFLQLGLSIEQVTVLKVELDAESD